MKIRAIVIGMVAGLILPLVGANAQAIFDPGLKASAGTALERGVAPTAENFGRSENEHKGDECEKGDDCRHRCDDGKGHDCHRCEDGDHSDKGHKDEECEKSKGKK